MNVLNSRAFSGMGRSGSTSDSMYNDTPVYDNNHDNVIWNGRRGDAMGEGQRRESSYGDSFGAPKRSSTWQDDVYDRPGGSTALSRSNTFASRQNDEDVDEFFRRDTFGSQKSGPGRPSAPKPNFAAKPSQLKANEAVAMFTFDADQPGDLGFKKGEVVTVTKKTDSTNDWWYVYLATLLWIHETNPCAQDWHMWRQDGHLPGELRQDEGVIETYRSRSAFFKLRGFTKMARRLSYQLRNSTTLNFPHDTLGYHGGDSGKGTTTHIYTFTIYYETPIYDGCHCLFCRYDFLGTRNEDIGLKIITVMVWL